MELVDGRPAMKFRQRCAWLMVVFFLGASFCVLHYLFEISEHYNKYALEHVHSHHQPEGKTKTEKGEITEPSSAWHHVVDIPMVVWCLLFLLPYLQMFFMILACTKAEPKMSLAFQWPCLMYIKYQRLIKGSSEKPYSMGVNSTVQTNGHMVYNT